MVKQTERQEFKEKLESELSEADKAYFSIYDDTSKFNVEYNVIELIQSLDDNKNG